MRIKLLLGLIVVGLLLGAWRSGKVFLRERLEEKLSQACQRQVSIQSLEWSSPLSVRLRGVEPFSIDRAEGRWELSSLLKAQPLFLLDLPERVLTDQGITPAVPWRIRDVQLRLQCVSHGYFSYARGELLGENGQPVGEFEWLGRPSSNGDQEGQLKVTHRQLQHLAPYFMRFIGVAPVEGVLSLKARVTVAGSDLAAENKLTAKDLVFPTAEPTVLGPAGDELVRLLRDPDGQIGLHFTVAGKMTDHFDWSEQMVVALRESLANGVTQSIQQALAVTEPIHTVEETLQKSLESSER